MLFSQLSALLCFIFLTLVVAPQRAFSYFRYEDTTAPLHRLPCEQGEHAPDLVLLAAEDGTSVSLSSFRGKLVYLELWATWCVACYPHMTRANEYATRPQWRGRLVCAAIALDKHTSTVASRVKSRGWDKIVHLVSGPDLTGREYIAVKALGAPMLPYAFLLNAEGVIMRRGDPSRVDFEQEIVKLLP